MSNIIAFGLRGFQVLTSVIVLGLSITLIKGQLVNLPASIGFAAFVGGVSLLGAFIGIAGVFVEFLQGIVGLAIDGFIILVNIAGGVLFAIKLGGANCQNNDMRYRRDKLKDIDLLNGGCAKEGKVTTCWNWIEGREKYLNSRCREATADSVFMFLTVIVLLVTATLLFLKRR